MTIEKKGQPYAVMISPEQYKAFRKAARERLRKIVRDIQTPKYTLRQ